MASSFAVEADSDEQSGARADEELLLHAKCDQLLAEYPIPPADPFELLRAQFDLGLAWVHFPEGRGGLALSPHLQNVIDGRLTDAVPFRPFERNLIGHGMAAPTILAHGTDEQQQRWLKPMFTTEEVWCQLFSEPGAGSDVASVGTQAVRDGDEWVVNGQKVWTSSAHVARWGLLLVRTDPSAPKHKGMTYFVLDMHTAGVEVRPLYQITGQAEFNEVYLTDVRVPDSHRLDEVGAGWAVALTTLMNERVAIGSSVTDDHDSPIGLLLRTWAEYGATADLARREEVVKLWISADALRLTNLRASQRRQTGTPGPEGSVVKLGMTELNKRIFNLAVQLMGAHGMLYGAYDKIRPRVGETVDRDVRRLFLRSRASSIEGGTSEIMRNILAERVLGLPSEPRIDKDRAWRDVPRS